MPVLDLEVRDSQSTLTPLRHGAMATNEATAAGVRLVLVGVRAHRARPDDRACGEPAAALAHYHSAAAGAPHHHCGAGAADAARGWSLRKDRRERLEMGTDPISANRRT